MSDEYTPTTDEIRRDWVQLSADAYSLVTDDADEVAVAEFDRWLEAHDREVAEKAFRAGWNASGEGWNGEYPDEGALWEISAGKQEYEKWADTEGATK